MINSFKIGSLSQGPECILLVLRKGINPSTPFDWGKNDLLLGAGILGATVWPNSKLCKEKLKWETLGTCTAYSMDDSVMVAQQTLLKKACVSRRESLNP